MKVSSRAALIKDVVSLIPGAAKSVYSLGQEDGEQAIKLLKGINLNKEGEISVDNMDSIVLLDAKNPERYILQAGDVVIMARGSSIRASYVSEEVAKSRVMASANFIIVRPNPLEICGEVIAAYLNSEVGASRLQSLSKGATIQHISTSDLKNLEVPTPSKETQASISEIFHANQEAYQATIALAEQQKQTANTTMLTMMEVS